MDTIVSHLDITQIFCDVDDFCQGFEHYWQQQPQLLAGLVAYTYQGKKPALDLNMKGLPALPPAIF